MDAIAELKKSAIAARSNAYAPYSRFNVGAAVLTKNKMIFAGCNVENASYGLAICAERTAIVKAISEGHKDFDAIAVCGGLTDTKYVSPCGACRQFIAEFGKDVKVIMISPDGKSECATTISELLPRTFTSDELEKV